uniref:DUF7936 family protein n=1 Tax=Stappia sp. TaxID=1870903 RepID=UPI003BA9FAC3
MTTIYTWSFPQFCTRPNVGELADVVCVVHWRLKGRDGTHEAAIYGSTTLPEPNPDNFRDFETLSEAEVIAWITPLLDVPAMEARLTRLLEEKKDPPIVTRAAPWA